MSEGVEGIKEDDAPQIPVIPSPTATGIAAEGDPKVISEFKEPLGS